MQSTQSLGNFFICFQDKNHFLYSKRHFVGMINKLFMFKCNLLQNSYFDLYSASDDIYNNNNLTVKGRATGNHAALWVRSRLQDELFQLGRIIQVFPPSLRLSSSFCSFIWPWINISIGRPLNQTLLSWMLSKRTFMPVKLYKFIGMTLALFQTRRQTNSVILIHSFVKHTLYGVYTIYQSIEIFPLETVLKYIKF